MIVVVRRDASELFGCERVRQGGDEMTRRMFDGRLIRDEQGMTTFGMVVAMLVALSLIFSAAQVYRVQSASAEVQEVADAAVLAAENEVAEFMIAVQVCDAVVLSMTLLSISTYGLGVAALCLPATAGLSSQLIEMASKVLQARNSFAEKAASGLNQLQKALPFLAAANAASVAAANNAGSSGSEYFAVAMLVPSEGKEIVIGDASALEEAGQAVDESAESIRDAAQRAEDAAIKANEAKQRAFEYDCGASPSYCMYERAGKLAGLSSGDNPLYQSVDTWSFSVPLKRARAYYAARYAAEAPTSQSVSEQANSVLRKRFYAYAQDELTRAYVVETDETFEAYFPHLFRNTSELRETPLYDEAVYPVTQGEGGQTMHAWAGCPEAPGATSHGSIRQLEGGVWVTCGQCEFTPSSLGNVAAASTSISNGFEHHYEAVAQAADEYMQARSELDPASREVKSQAGSLIDALSDAASSLANVRIEAEPPGSSGAVAMVVNVGSVSADQGFSSLFVSGGSTLGVRAAVSGAHLRADEAHDNASVISSLLDGFGQNSGAVVGAARVVLECWSFLLSAYTQGQEALTDALHSALDSLPLVGPSGLGTWAAGKLTGAFESLGLAPAELDALKPVLVNTGEVVAGESGGFAVQFASAKQRALSLSSSSTSLFTALVDEVESEAFDRIERLGNELVIARIDFPVGDLQLPITLTLPSFVTDSAKGLVSQAVDALRAAVGAIVPTRVWS